MNEVVTMACLKWVDMVWPSEFHHRCLRKLHISLGSDSTEYVIDLGLMTQRRIIKDRSDNLTLGSTRRLKIDMPVTHDMIRCSVGVTYMHSTSLWYIPLNIQCSILEREARTDVPDCGALWRAYTPEVNTEVVDEYRKWVNQGASTDEQESCFTMLVAGVEYTVNFAVMTQTRTNVDWRTGERSRGTERQFRVDAIIHEASLPA